MITRPYRFDGPLSVRRWRESGLRADLPGRQKNAWRRNSEPAKGPAGGWTKIANATAVPLKMQDQFAIGSFKLPMGAVADRTYAIQFSYVNADAKTIFTEPHLVRLTFPKNPMSVTLSITAIPDLPTRRYLEDTVPTLFEGKVSVKSKTNDSLVLEIDPVADPKTVEPRIKFGKVTSVQGRTFAVVANKVELPMPTAAEVSAALADVQSTDRQRRIAGADQLAKAYLPLPQSRMEVAKALEANIADKDIWTANAALRALLVWGGPENIAGLTAVMENNLTRTTSMEVLGKFKDPAVAAAIAKWLPGLGDRSKVSTHLKAIGPAAEKAVIPFLTHTDNFTVNEACNILKETGTEQCIPALTQVANSNNNFVNGNARATLKIVQAGPKGELTRRPLWFPVKRRKPLARGCPGSG